MLFCQNPLPLMSAEQPACPPGSSSLCVQPAMVCNTEPGSFREYSPLSIFPLGFCMHAPHHKPLLNSLMAIPCSQENQRVHWFKMGVTLPTAVLGVKFQRSIHNKNKGAVLRYWCSSYLYQLLICTAPYPQHSEILLFRAVGHLPIFSPPICLVLAHCSLTISIFQATFTSFSLVFLQSFLLNS